MIPLDDKWLRIIGITILWIINIVSHGYYHQPLTTEVILLMLISLVSITVAWHVMRALVIYFRQTYSLKEQMLKRLLLTFLTGTVASALVKWLMDALRYLTTHGTLVDYQPMEQTASVTVDKTTFAFSVQGFDVVQASITFVCFQIIYETLFFARTSSLYQKQLKQAEQERERLRMANLQSQLDALKQQVNPHFLFNSLNVLDSLIDDDPQQARVFLDELSTVYRYLLRSNEHHLTDLNSELAFINSYFHLLKTRHGAGVNLNVTVDDRYQTYQLPPLTLQLLVENAVKHNIVLPDQPLTIDITTEGQSSLQIRNNIQRKSVRVASNGVGLTNILTKYQMLGQPAPTIQETENMFVVTLPLIAAK